MSRSDTARESTQWVWQHFVRHRAGGAVLWLALNLIIYLVAVNSYDFVDRKLLHPVLNFIYKINIYKIQKKIITISK